MDRDGRQGWSRKAEEAWLRVFGDPGPKAVAFPDAIERKLVEGFKPGPPCVVPPAVKESHDRYVRDRVDPR